MGEISNFAAGQAESRSAFERQRAARIEAERKVSRQRAKEFVAIMHQHQVAQIPFCQEGSEGWLKPILGTFLPNPWREELEKPTRKLSVVSLGWVAVNDVSTELGEKPTGIFVSEAAETYLCSPVRKSGDTAYVTPRYGTSIGSSVPEPTDGLLAPNNMLAGMADKLIELGIK